MSIIPKKIDPEQKKSAKDFTRESKLTLPRLIALLLSAVASANKCGLDYHAGQFFKNAARAGLWAAIEAVHRSAVSKARLKVPLAVFQDVMRQAVKVAYDLWPASPQFQWHGLSVFAIDGSWYDLPATDEIRKEFDPGSGLQNPGKGHYPQCLVSTVYDVFRRLPIMRTVVGIHGAERTEALEVLPFIPKGLIMFDQGYYGFGFVKKLIEGYQGFFLMRCPALSSFPAFSEMVEKGLRDIELLITPSCDYLRSLPKEMRKVQKPIRLRAIRMDGPDGNISILLTNLFDRREYPTREILDLYARRWEVESHYRNEKVVMEVEKFHARTVLGIRQELLAAAVMTIISRTIMVLSRELTDSKAVEPQFANAVNALAAEAAVLAATDSEKAIRIFWELINEIARVKYYRCKKKRPTQPRVTKRRLNKWAVGKIKIKGRA